MSRQTFALFARTAMKVCRTLLCRSQTKFGCCRKFAVQPLTTRKFYWNGSLKSLVFRYNLLSKFQTPPPRQKKLAEAAAKLLKNPRDVKERAALEAFIARELYGLSLDDWKHLTSTFTFGGDSDTKAELDAIIRQSLTLW